MARGDTIRAVLSGAIRRPQGTMGGTFDTAGRGAVIPQGVGELRAAARVPTGKGMFVRHLAIDTGTPEQCAAQCRWANLHWLPIEAIWQDKDGWVKRHNEGLFQEYGAALREAGVRPWIWGYPHPEKTGEFTDVVAAAVEQSGASGVLLDPEGPWLGATTQQAVALVQSMRAALPGTMLGVTSYPKPIWVPGLPWDGFLGCDFGLPQVYDSQGDQGPSWQAQGVENYQAAGFRAVVPALPSFGPVGTTPQDIVTVFDRTPRPDGAVIWWDWKNCNAKQNWAGIRAVLPPRPQVPTPGALSL